MASYRIAIDFEASTKAAAENLVLYLKNSLTHSELPDSVSVTKISAPLEDNDELPDGSEDTVVGLAFDDIVE